MLQQFAQAVPVRDPHDGRERVGRVVDGDDGGWAERAKDLNCEGTKATCADDHGCHTVCVEVTAEFLAFSLEAGNDLSTPRPEYRFPGLKDGDRWCLCAGRWEEARVAGFAPEVVLEATHAKTLEITMLGHLQAHAV